MECGLYLGASREWSDAECQLAIKHLKKICGLLLCVAIKHVPKKQKADLISACMISLPSTYRWHR